MKKLITIMLISVFLNGTEVDCNANNYKADITAKQAYEMQKKGNLIVDIRTKEEFAELRPKGAILIPAWNSHNGKRVWNKTFVEELTKTFNGDITKDIVIICRTGSRTKCVANYLSYLGFTNVYNVKDGFALDWFPNRLPMEK